jgi:hypothetical protein
MSKKKLFYKLVNKAAGGSYIAGSTPNEIAMAVENELCDMDQAIDDPKDTFATTLQLEPMWMTQEEFDAMPEFDGW